jgi:hypothetical protein
VKTIPTLSVEELVRALGYSGSENWRDQENEGPETAHLRRRAREAGVVGIYSFRTSPDAYELLPKRAVVQIAQANNADEAREIHRKLWNLSDAPFLLIVLPNHVRVYTNFRYDSDEDTALLSVPNEGPIELIAQALDGFHSQQIDSGYVWRRWGDKLPPASRVDQRLLDDLNELGRILIDNRELRPETAHALIGKFIYIRYLLDREILSSRWLEEHGILESEVLGREATVTGLSRLVEALETRFNGRIFPLPLAGDHAPSDADVSFVASIFRGDSPTGQLALDFKIYDFFYIPIELLSSIYEQFLHVQGKGKKVGAYYTSEPLADYLLSEINSVLPLRSGHKVLDPCCGSGVFLVLAYRRLIEMELQSRPSVRLRPIELREILVESIFGVERNLEACYVAEFSLILTMLSYIEPPELHRNKRFKFPNLHETNIFHADFFGDVVERLLDRRLAFDWIVGNPPWVELSSADSEEAIAVDWIRVNAVTRPIARFRACEAFTWRAPDLLNRTGYVGFVVHAKSLTNEQSGDYRRAFFTSHEVAKVTNFSNLAHTLFKGRAAAPAATIIYKPTDPEALDAREAIVHYSPFVVNQLPIRELRSKQSWVITVYENEITTVDPRDAADGSARTWKTALWGTYRDQMLIKRFERLFPQSLEQLCESSGWAFGLGIQLRTEADHRSGDVVRIDRLTEKKVLDFDEMNLSGKRFEVPAEALQENQLGYIRKRGGKRGLRLIRAPHLVITPSYAAFSAEDFIVKHPRVAISAQPEDTEHLRALSVYLNSNIARYLAFFSSTRWGIDRVTAGYVDIAAVRVPSMTVDQIKALASLHERCCQEDGTASGAKFDLFTQDYSDILGNLTSEVGRVLRLPQWIIDVVDEFISIRLAMINGKTGGDAVRSPRTEDLVAYVETLRGELETYAKVPHRIGIHELSEFIVCEITVNGVESTIAKALFRTSASEEMLWQMLRTAESQWVYVQRGLRIIESGRMYLFKPKRLIDWTRTQALLDSDDVIAEVLAHVRRKA